MARGAVLEVASGLKMSQRKADSPAHAVVDDLEVDPTAQLALNECSTSTPAVAKNLWSDVPPATQHAHDTSERGDTGHRPSPFSHVVVTDQQPIASGPFARRRDQGSTKV